MPPSAAVNRDQVFVKSFANSCDCKNQSFLRALTKYVRARSLDYLRQNLAVQGVLINWAKLETIVERADADGRT